MRRITRYVMEAFLAKYSTNEQVLDIGAGDTRYSKLFPNRTTFDIDPERKPDILGNVESMPFSENSYSTIICSEVLEHLPNLQQSIKEIKRVLKPNGLLVLTTRFVYPIHDAPGDYWRFTPFGIEQLFSDWDIVEIASDTEVFSTIAVLIQRIIFQTKLRGGKLTKGCLYLLMLIFMKLDGLLLVQYGDIKRMTIQKNILSAGVFIACRNIK